MEIILNWTQLHSGLSTPILENYSEIHYIQNNWFLQLREFLKSTNSKIIIRSKWLPTMKRQGDWAIMDMMNKLPISRAIKTIFNNWRLYFQVDTLADITTIEGNKIEDKFMNKKGKGIYKRDQTSMS
jgi:hypothetical protein